MSIPQQGGGPIERFEQLADYIASGEKPQADWRIGTEHEKFGFDVQNQLPLPYEGAASIRALLEALRDRFGWEPILEQDKLIGLTREGANISLEPGGQFELSGAPMVSLHDTKAELERHFAELAEITGPMGVAFMGLGAAPVWRAEQMPMMPKGRYRLMTNYMDRVGTMGKTMMYRTSTVQVNLDFASEADMVAKMRVALALQPVATALFASSPFLDGRENGFKSWRANVWQNLDPARTGMLPFMFEPGAGYERYVDYVLDVPMYFVYRDGKYIDALGQSFRDFLNGKLPALPGALPTLSDWADHMTTVFPEARVKKYIEMRGADAGSKAHLVALPALWTGLMYDAPSLAAAADLTRGWGAVTHEAFRRAAGREALKAVVETETGPVKMLDLAREVVAIARAGLRARAQAGQGWADESGYLDVLEPSLASGQVVADDYLALYHSAWAGELSPLYTAAQY